MDQPTPPLSPSGATQIISSQILKIEAALGGRARATGTSFLYRSEVGTKHPIEVLVSPEGMSFAHLWSPDWVRVSGVTDKGTHLQLLLSLLDEAPRLCAQATEFYDRVAALREDECARVIDNALARLAAPAHADVRGASMPRD